MVLLILLLAVSFAGAAVRRNDAALRAMEQMRLSVKVGDPAEVVIRLISRDQTASSTFTVVMHYGILGVDQPASDASPAGYRLSLQLRSAGTDGLPAPPGFDDAMRAMFPPLELRTNGDFEDVEILNWEQVERQRKAVQQKLTSDHPKVAIALLLLTSMISHKDALAGMFSPIGEMQRRSWRSKGDGFDLTVTRRHGVAISLEVSQQPVVVTGRRRLIPTEVSDGKVRAAFTTTYDMTGVEASIRKSPLGELLGKDVGWTMRTYSKGDAEYDLQTGWVERIREKLTIEIRLPATRMPARSESVELVQRRIP